MAGRYTKDIYKLITMLVILGVVPHTDSWSEQGLGAGAPDYTAPACSCSFPSHLRSVEELA